MLCSPSADFNMQTDMGGEKKPNKPTVPKGGRMGVKNVMSSVKYFVSPDWCGRNEIFVCSCWELGCEGEEQKYWCGTEKPNIAEVNMMDLEL